MKNIKQYKSFIIGLIIGLSFIGFSTYAATTGAGTIGSLFGKMTSTIGDDLYGTYKLLGDNIKDNTIDSGELEADSVGNSELKNSEVFDIAKLGIGTNHPSADLHIKGDGAIKLEGKNSTNYWVFNPLDNGTDMIISRSGQDKAKFKQNGDLEVIGKIKAKTPVATDSGDTVVTKEYVDSNSLGIDYSICIDIIFGGEKGATKSCPTNYVMIGIQEMGITTGSKHWYGRIKCCKLK